MNKLYTFASQALYILTLLFFAITLLYAWQSALSTEGYSTFILLGFIPAILMTIFVSRWMNRRFTNKQNMIIIILLAFGVRLAWILTIQTTPIQDFERMYLGALDIARGTYEFITIPYFTTWVYQLGFTTYQAGVISLFGEGTFMIKFLNVLYCTGITFFIYSIGSKLFNEWSGRIAALMFAIYVPNIVMTSVLTNQHLATFLFYAAFALFVAKGLSHSYAWIFVGILLSLGNIMRPLGSVILLALIIFAVIAYMLGKKQVKKKTIFAKLVGIIGVFYIVNYVFSYSLIAAGITQYPLSNRDPYWKFVLGFNHETTGGFSVPDYELVNQYEVGKERFAVEKELIAERTEDKKQLLILLKDKLKLMWGDYDASIYWGFEGYDVPNVKDAFWIVEKIMYLSIVLFAVIALLALIKERKNEYLLFFLLLILGYVAVHLLIEIQTRYRYFIMPTFIILQGYGIYLLAQLGKKKAKS
ncbi:glycosyltransferase family 39 protein [Bacillus manliponensis]|uniref:glycosyltransferase family 39 protein n=1 Tax=Bacillus manliponensis TaxID=574376 RepID=UPI003518C9F6